MKVHEALAAAILDQNVEVMFGLIGDGNLFMVDSYVKRGTARYVSAANEAGAVLMAIGYASVSGKVGVATVTHGPAITNTLTPLIEATKASLPIVLFAGDTAGKDLYHLQNVDQREFFLATGAGFVQLRGHDTVAQDVALAFRRARVEKRPIVLNMPADYQWLDTDYAAAPAYIPATAAFTVDGPDMDNAVGIIAAAKRPVVVCGRGACEPEARRLIAALADRIEAPVASTLKAKGAFQGHPFNLGIFGTFSTPVGLETILESDCVIAFGASLNAYTTAQGSLLRGKRLIHVSADPADLGRHVVPDAGLVGEPGRTAQRIVQLLDEAEIGPSGYRSESLRTALAAYRHQPRTASHPREGAVDITQALLAIEDAMAPERTVVTDAGRFLIETWQIFTVRDPRSFVYTVNFGAIGFGVAEAIGAAMASDGRPTLLVTGDGGFMLGSLNEFHSAVRAGIDLAIVVCNDGSYGAEHIQFRNKQMDPSLSVFDWPDLAPVAEALGGRGVTVRSAADLPKALEALRQRGRVPLLIDLKLDPDCIPTMGH